MGFLSGLFGALPAIGGLAGLGLSASAKQKAGKVQQLPTFSPQQMGMQNDVINLYRALLPQAQGYLSDLLGQDSESVDRFNAPYLQEFGRSIAPQIAAMYGGPGHSSTVDRLLSRAGTDLATQLASFRETLRGGALSGLQGFGDIGMKSPFENMYRQAAPSPRATLGAGLAQGFLPGLSSIAQSYQQRQMQSSLADQIARAQGGR